MFFGLCGNDSVNFANTGAANPSIRDTAHVLFPTDRFYCFVE